MTTGYSLFLTLLTCLHLCLANYENGNLVAGERYKASFQHRAYNIYPFPYGIVFHQVIPQVTFVSFVISHTKCPNGQNCDRNGPYYAVLQVKFNDMMVNLVTNFTGVNAKQPLSQYYFIPEVSVTTRLSSYAIPINDMASSPPGNGDLLKLRYDDGAVIANFPNPVYPSAIRISFGGTDKYLNYHICYDRSTSRILVIDMSDQDSFPRLSAAFPLSTYFSNPSTSSIISLSVDANHNCFYLIGYDNRIPTLIRHQYWQNLTYLSLPTDLISKGFVPSTVFVNEVSGQVYVAYTNFTMNREDFQTDDSTYLLRISANFQRIEQILVFPNKLINGYFWNYMKDTLYILGNGMLVRIYNNGTSNMTYGGKMSIRTSLEIDLSSRANNLDLVSGRMLDNDTTAILGSSWWGNLAVVNLERFVDIDQELALQPSIDPVQASIIIGSVLGGAFVISFVLVLVGVIIVLVLKSRKTLPEHYSTIS